MAKGRSKGKTVSVGTHLAAPGNQKGNFAKGGSTGGGGSVNASMGESAAGKCVGTAYAPKGGSRGK